RYCINQPTQTSARYQTFLDSTVPHLTPRWITTLVMMFLFMARIFYLQGWYIVTYALGIYQLNLFIAFLTPKIDPALDELGESDIVMYFIVLFIITMKRQIKHMIKYRYLPFTYGKQKYRGKDDSGDVMKS
ncbi:Protein RER1, partial [Acropora cervicornis]